MDGSECRSTPLAFLDACVTPVLYQIPVGIYMIYYDSGSQCVGLQSGRTSAHSSFPSQQEHLQRRIVFQQKKKIVFQQNFCCFPAEKKKKQDNLKEYAVFGNPLRVRDPSPPGGAEEAWWAHKLLLRLRFAWHRNHTHTRE
jgi:hypothetical protein